MNVLRWHLGLWLSWLGGRISGLGLRLCAPRLVADIEAAYAEIDRAALFEPSSKSESAFFKPLPKEPR